MLEVNGTPCFQFPEMPYYLKAKIITEDMRAQSRFTCRCGEITVCCAPNFVYLLVFLAPSSSALSISSFNFNLQVDLATSRYQLPFINIRGASAKMQSLHIIHDTIWYVLLLSPSILPSIEKIYLTPLSLPSIVEVDETFRSYF